MHKSTTVAPAAECTCFLLRRLSRRVSQVYDQHLARAGLRTTQYSMLSFIRRDGQIPMSALAAALGMDRSTLSRNIKPLIDAGYVEQHGVSDRQRMPPSGAAPAPDPRAKVLALTPGGLEQWRLARVQWKLAQQAMRESLGEPHLHALHDMIDRTLQHLPEETAA